MAVSSRVSLLISILRLNLFNGVFLPDMILMILCYYHWGTRLNTIKRFLSLQPMILPKRFDMFSPWRGDAQEDYSRCSLFL